jgi:hypothetical protein
MYNNYDGVMLPYINEFYQNNMRTLNNPTMTTLELNNKIRQLWEQHITWTRLAIMSIASDSPGTQLVSNRLLRNATDFGNLFANFYRPEIAQSFGKLIKDHLSIAADLVVAAKKQDNNAVSNIEKKWYKNADDIANFLNFINPFWNKNKIRDMMYKHLALTKDEAVAILKNEYEKGITLFEKIENQALMMADDYTQGFIKQFPNKFIS